MVAAAPTLLMSVTTVIATIIVVIVVVATAVIMVVTLIIVMTVVKAMVGLVTCYDRIIPIILSAARIVSAGTRSRDFHLPRILFSIGIHSPPPTLKPVGLMTP